MTTADNPPEPRRSFRPSLPGDSSLLTKLAVIGVIALATLIPSLLVSGLVAEREGRQAEVEADIARSWGAPQQVGGPLLVIPAMSPVGRPVVFLKVAAKTLSVTVHLSPGQRRRGLFAATVYEAKIEIGGTFVLPQAETLTAMNDPGQRLAIEDGMLVVDMAGLQGLKADDHVTIDGTDSPWRACGDVGLAQDSCGSGSVVVATLGPGHALDKPIAFTAVLHLKGTARIALKPAARDATVGIDAPWPNPGYIGSQLPDSASQTATGFNAAWQVRDFGGARTWITRTVVDETLPGPLVGVDLIDPAPIYRMITRVPKYGILLVALSFATYLSFELVSGVRIHPVQYGLLAASLVLFPLLLLSIGEFTGYAAGYLISALLVMGQATLYTASVARRMGLASLFAALLAGLFGFLYVLLGLETYALLAGSAALFVLLSIVMALGQRADWAFAAATMRPEAGGD